MAGIGEACFHIAAVLFTIEANTNMKQQFSCTSLPCSWLPSSFRSVTFTEISKMDFSTPTSKRIQCQKKTDEHEESESAPKKKIVSIPEPTENDLELFYNDLSKTRGKPVILSLLPNYNESYIPAYESGILPKPLTELHNPEAMKMTYLELLNKCEQTYQSVMFTFDQALLVEEQTRGQVKSHIWFEQRAGRITASRLREAVHTNYLQPSLLLVKSICYPEQRQFTSATCQYGCNHEDLARQMHTQRFSAEHEDFLVIKSGLILDPKFPFLGASPDGLVNCKCCNTGVLEIKCPFSCKQKSFVQLANDNSSFCLDNDNGSLTLKVDHPYYFQVQLQMKLCHVQYCDFVIWRESGEIFCQRISLDLSFVDSAISSVTPLIKYAILPELVGKWFSNQTLVSDDSSNSIHNNSVNGKDCSFNDEGYCYCGRGEDYDDMIGCDNKHCPIGWFHYSCLRIAEEDVPKGKYYCPECHKKRSKTVTNAVM